MTYIAPSLHGEVSMSIQYGQTQCKGGARYVILILFGNIIWYKTELKNEVIEDYSYSKTPVQIPFHTRFDIWIDFGLNLSEISESLSFDLQGCKKTDHSRPHPGYS